jgi:serine/threonine protein kinase
LLKKGENGVFRVKIIDWGLGALLDKSEQKNRVCGTPEYCAP